MLKRNLNRIDNLTRGNEMKPIVLGKTIKKGDIVTIKFKKLEDIISFYSDRNRMREIIDYTGIQNHFDSFTSGGSFKIVEVNSTGWRQISTGLTNNVDNNTAPIEFDIEDHREHCSEWTITESMIESIEIVESDI